ncbi:hypothetical protein shim_07430 [Shimia sp. SK013]|uniref:ferric reductase-like transmembrane domain-containing protein n=1 Tax=Shimia sp. SK013 TaxID=1389006 RepID=UPI0006B500EA|nr:ferric reductase-like transmembrane domain-containing protein [Shimia sp. SK013]KPA22460.1 hypothetical protein shim_07430 [Shimia sp. SK013]
MAQTETKRTRRSNTSSIVIWSGLILALATPLIVASFNPYLAYRNPAYIAAGFAGILALLLLILQPLLAGGLLPNVPPRTARLWHRATGSLIIVAVVVHVAGLFVTSPPDTLDALLLVSPTPFSLYGVVALWGVILTGLLVTLRRKLPLRYLPWAILHNTLAFLIVMATVVHALLIDGTMGPLTKWLACLVVVLLTTWVLYDIRIRRKRAPSSG